MLVLGVWLALILTVVSSCHNNRYYTKPLNRYMYESWIVNNHLEWALDDLMIEYYDKDVLPFAVYMAEVCGYTHACLYIYEIYEDFYLKRGSQRELYKGLAIAYLKRGADLKDESCCLVLSSLLEKGKYVTRNDSLAVHYSRLASKDSVNEN